MDAMMPACLHGRRRANQPARQGQQQCCSGHRCSAAEAAAVPARAIGEDSSDSIVQCKHRGARKTFHPPKYLKRKKGKIPQMAV